MSWGAGATGRCRMSRFRGNGMGLRLIAVQHGRRGSHRVYAHPRHGVIETVTVRTAPDATIVYIRRPRRNRPQDRGRLAPRTT
jgi:hypothetical protein